MNEESLIESSGTLKQGVVAILVAIGLSVAAMLGQNIATLAALPLIFAGASESLLITVGLVLGGVGLMVPSLGYVYYRTDAEQMSDIYDYIYLHKPGWEIVKPTVVGMLMLFVVYFAISVVITSLGIGVGDNQALVLLEENPELIPVLFVGVVIIAPITEEIVFRGVVQRRLHEHIQPIGAILVACALFGVVHIPAVTGGIQAGMVYAGFVGVTSIFYGYLYYRLENIFVPIIMHSVYNAAIFGVFLIQLSAL